MPQKNEGRQYRTPLILPEPQFIKNHRNGNPVC